MIMINLSGSLRTGDPGSAASLLADSALITELRGFTTSLFSTCHVLPTNNANRLLGHPKYIVFDLSDSITIHR
jgi:hypothetical protein